MDPSSNIVVEGLVPVYRGNTMNSAERSRFDFPERSYEGQPIGVRLSGTQSQHQHDIMSRDEPSYTYSPTQQEIAVSPIAMPKIKNVSPQSKPTEMMGIRRDQDNYLSQLRDASVRREADIMSQTYGQESYRDHHQAQLFSPEMAPNKRVGNPNQTVLMGDQSPQMTSVENQEALYRRQQQEAFARQLDMDKTGVEIRNEHEILLNQGRPTSSSDMVPTETSKVLMGYGQHSELTGQDRVRKQAEYRAMVSAAAAMKEQPSPNRPPRIRPESPKALIIGENFLNTIGKHDSPAFKAKQLAQNKAIIAENNKMQTLRDEMARQMNDPEYIKQMHQNTMTIKKLKEEVPDRAPHEPSAYVKRQLMAQRQNMVEQQQGSNGSNSVNQKTLAQQNFEMRKAKQIEYAQALNQDKTVAPIAVDRISIHDTAKKRANNRWEAVLMSEKNEIVQGKNLIETVGQYDIDHHDPTVKRELQKEYAEQISQAQSHQYPVGIDPAETYQPLMPRLKARSALPEDTFKQGNYTREAAYHDKSLQVHGEAEYTGRSRAGFHANDPIYQQMRAADKEKQKEFAAQVEDTLSQQPLTSPRTTLYRRKHATKEKDYDLSTPYGMLTASLSNNEDVLGAKGLQEGKKKLNQQLLVSQLEADKVRKEQALSQPSDRFSAYATGKREALEAKYAQNDTEADHREAEGLPMYTKYDWNENALDYKWNSNQDPMDRSTDEHFNLKHGTYQMHYGIPEGSPRGNSNQQEDVPPGLTGTEQGQQAMAVNRPGLTSLPLYGVEKDHEKALLMRNQALYEQGMLTDRSRQTHVEMMKTYLSEANTRLPLYGLEGDHDKAILQKNHLLYQQGQLSDRHRAEHEQRLFEVMAQAARHQHDYPAGEAMIPTLTLPSEQMQVAAAQGMSQIPHKESYESYSQDQQITARIAQGLQPKVSPRPPLGDPYRSSFPSDARRIGGASTLERNNRGGVSTNPGQDRVVQKAGFAVQKSPVTPA